MNCTRCGKELKELNDFKIDISFEIGVNRMKEDGIWEYIPNLNQISKEILCYDCFNKFSELMAQLNIKHND